MDHMVKWYLATANADFLGVAISASESLSNAMNSTVTIGTNDVASDAWLDFR